MFQQLTDILQAESYILPNKKKTIKLKEIKFPFMPALHVAFAYVVMPSDDTEHHLLAT